MDQAATHRRDPVAGTSKGTVAGRTQLLRLLAGPMPYLRDSFWRGRQFTSLAQMQAEAVRSCTVVAGARAC